MEPTYRMSWAGSNYSSLALVSCLFGGYKFASVLRCVGLILYQVASSSS